VRQEGNPNPNEAPKREETSKMYAILDVSNITINTEAIIPTNIQKDRNVSRLGNFFTKAVPNTAKPTAAAH